MADTKWTPGPWRIENNPYPHVRTSDESNRCVFARDYAPEANRHLIVAAPDLYEALSAIVGSIDFAADHHLIHEAQDILAKARGESA